MHALFAENDAQAQAAYLSFERSYRAVVDRFGITIVPSALDVVAKLSGSHVKVCLFSGFSGPMSRLVLDRLGVSLYTDLTLCLEDVPRGCPWPDLIPTAVIRLGIGMSPRSPSSVTARTSSRPGAAPGPACWSACPERGRLSGSGRPEPPTRLPPSLNCPACCCSG